MIESSRLLILSKIDQVIHVSLSSTPVSFSEVDGSSHHRQLITPGTSMSCSWLQQWLNHDNRSTELHTPSQDHRVIAKSSISAKFSVTPTAITQVNADNSISSSGPDGWASFHSHSFELSQSRLRFMSNSTRLFHIELDPEVGTWNRKYTE